MANKAKKLPMKKRKKPDYKKGWETRRRNAARKAPPALNALRTAHVDSVVNQAKADGERSLLEPTQAGSTQSHGAPGHGEIVGGEDAKLADRIVKLARSKNGGADAVQAELMAMRQHARHSGAIETDQNATKRLIEVQERIDERIVCGFVSEVDDASMRYRGLPPNMVWTLNSFTVVKIVDALNKAGYRATGKN